MSPRLIFALGFGLLGCNAGGTTAASTSTEGAADDATGESDSAEFTGESTSSDTSEVDTSEADTSQEDLGSPDLPGAETGEPEPYCCGCLCVDDRWSCSDDTCVTEEGKVVGLDAEAGFFEIEGGDYVVNWLGAQSGHSRLWYVFHPAQEDPQDKPLLVFFNGGPGSSTAPLLSYNTAPTTLDQVVTGGEPYAATAEPWTRVGNLLYIDAPNTGFSYTLPLEGGIEPSVRIDPDRDAATFVKLVVRFLARHPDLQDNRVIIVAESYGGVRSQLMLRELLDYEDLTDGYFQDLGLHAELTEHYATVFPETDGTGVLPERIADQFSHQVLIQAVVSGITQLNLPVPGVPAGCMSNGDLYQCDEPDGYTFDRIYEAASQLVKLDVLEQMIGVDPTTIEWMHAENRTEAYGREFISVDEAGWVDLFELQAEFGELNATDNYFIGYNSEVNQSHPQGSWSMDPLVGHRFLFNAYYVESFLTDSAFDRAVWSPNIPPSFEDYPELVSTVVHDIEPRPGYERSGWISLTYEADAIPASVELERELRFPHYGSSGHIVTHRQPEDLLADVEQWLLDSSG